MGWGVIVYTFANKKFEQRMNKYLYFLLSIQGVPTKYNRDWAGYKSVDCIRLLSLRHRRFPASYHFQMEIVIVIGVCIWN
jgi:hypothetical protein